MAVAFPQAIASCFGQRGMEIGNMPNFSDIWTNELQPIARLWVHDQFTMDSVKALCSHTWDRAQAFLPQPTASHEPEFCPDCGSNLLNGKCINPSLHNGGIE
jgi:hypothetical protein